MGLCCGAESGDVEFASVRTGLHLDQGCQRPVGAELHGTGPRIWHELAPGTDKDSGYFWIGAHGSREIVLCESAIDAVSCFQLNPQCICISTPGVRSNPPWLQTLLARGYELHCGFDADGPGDGRPC